MDVDVAFLCGPSKRARESLMCRLLRRVRTYWNFMVPKAYPEHGS